MFIQCHVNAHVIIMYLLMLGTHAHVGYSSLFICFFVYLSVCLFLSIKLSALQKQTDRQIDKEINKQTTVTHMRMRAKH